ncbi:kelch-like protein 6 [Gigantopelta aegis]|uniref:kelch-like protein 6 n=1 Tax=Gigantopelta aegis TaxID=1735272 RepID=UPI001B889DE7|nr:kelch-like protein 6 [Gigantopelta aegis]
MSLINSLWSWFGPPVDKREEVQKSFLKHLYEKLVQGDYNDIKLVFKDGSTTGSRLCLTALSSYFESMFASDMLEKNTRVVTLPTVSKQTFDDVLKFHILGEDVVNNVNCFLLFDVADMMQLDDLKSVCLRYLNNNLTLTTENCVLRWRSLKKYGMEDLAAKAFQYVVKNADKLSENGSLIDLTTDEYLQVLSHDDLPQKEDDVLRDVQKWISQHNPSVEIMVDLFTQIRFEHVSISYLTDDVIYTAFFKEHEALQQVVQKGINTWYSFHTQMNTFIDNRISGQMLDVVFVLQNSAKLLSVACLSDKRWYELPKCSNKPGTWFAAAVLDKSIYITGGDETQKSMRVFNVWRRTWSRGPDLKHNRCEHCMAVLDDMLYVIGGKHSNTIEQLQLGQDEWQVVGDLGCTRQDSCAEAVGENILVMGGRLDRRVTDQVHCFNTNTHAVSTINIQLKSGNLTRSYLEMPNLYLLHYDGSVDVIHIDDINTRKLRAERVAKYDKYGYHFGFVYTDGSIIVTSKKGLEKLDIRNGSKESVSLRNTQSFSDISGVLHMQIPRLCVQ